MKYLLNCLYSFFYQGHFTLVNVIALFFYISLLILIILAIVLFNHGLIQYVNSKWNGKFTSVIQVLDYLLDIIYWRYAPGIVLMAAVMYGIYFTVIVGMIGIELINGINRGGQKGTNMGTGMPGEGELNMVDMAGLNIKDMNIREQANIEGIKENSMHIIKEGGRIITPNLDFYNNLKRGFLIPQMVSHDPARRGECEQLLINMQLLGQLKNIYPEFTKYFFCPIKQLKAGADAVLFNSCTQDFTAFQLKFFTGNSNNKLPKDFLPYQLTTDVLEITINHNVGFNQLVNRIGKHSWLFDIGIQTYGQQFDENFLMQSIKSHHNFLHNYTIGGENNYEQINDIYQKNVEDIYSKDNYCKDIERYGDGTVVDALKEIKLASLKQGQQMETIMRSGGYPLE